MRAGASSIRCAAWRIFAATTSSIVGGGDSALDWTLNLQPLAKSLTLVHRRPEFRAAPDSVNKMFALQERGELAFQLGQVTGLVGEGGDLKAAVREGAGRRRRDRRRRGCLPFFGLTMKLGPVADWGLNLHEELIAVDTAKFETLRAGHLRHRRHQHLSGQAEAHPLAASTRRR